MTSSSDHAYRAENRLEWAIVDFNECINRDANVATAYERRGLAYESLKESENAIDDLTKAISLGRKNSAVFRARASAYIMMGRLDEALRDLDFVVLQKRDLDTYLMRASVRASLKKFTLAVDDLSESVALRPTDVDLLRRRAILLQRLQRWGEAEADYRHIIFLDPINNDALNSLGYMFAQRGKHLAEARDLIQRALNRSPDNPFYLDSMGWLHYKLGDYDNAQRYLLRAAAVLDRNAEIQEHLGEVCWKRNHKAESLAYFKRAIQLLERLPEQIRDVDSLNRLRAEMSSLQAEKPEVKTQRKRRMQEDRAAVARPD